MYHPVHRPDTTSGAKCSQTGQTGDDVEDDSACDFTGHNEADQSGDRRAPQVAQCRAEGLPKFGVVRTLTQERHPFGRCRSDDDRGRREDEPQHCRCGGRENDVERFAMLIQETIQMSRPAQEL
jgi:hypothetical protein